MGIEAQDSQGSAKRMVNVLFPFLGERVQLAGPDRSCPETWDQKTKKASGKQNFCLVEGRNYTSSFFFFSLKLPSLLHCFRHRLLIVARETCVYYIM